VPLWNLIPFSEKVSYEEGALCEPFAVSLHAFKMAHFEEGQTVAVVGTGTIGFMIAEIARRAGASKVIVCGRSENKLEFAKSLNFETLNIRDEQAAEQLRALTESDGANVVFECVGSPESINQAVECCAAFGTVVLVGNPTGDITFGKATYWKILRQQLTVKGTWNSSYNSRVNDWREAMEMFENGKVDFKPFISRTYSLQQADEAFKTLLDPETFTLKVMFTM
jgi:L-iditol 2-dehydrogenase